MSMAAAALNFKIIKEQNECWNDSAKGVTDTTLIVECV